jgi:hypothetical protein
MGVTVRIRNPETDPVRGEATCNSPKVQSQQDSQTETGSDLILVCQSVIFNILQ